jgi:hypothetical protein
MSRSREPSRGAPKSEPLPLPIDVTAAFSFLDLDGDGVISYRDLHDVLAALYGEEPSPEEVRQLLGDPDGLSARDVQALLESEHLDGFDPVKECFAYVYLE